MFLVKRPWLVTPRTRYSLGASGFTSEKIFLERKSLRLLLIGSRIIRSTSILEYRNFQFARFHEELHL